MGGTIERIAVLPIAEAEDPWPEPIAQREALGELTGPALERFQAFDVYEADCFMKTEKHRLLAVIEAAYGDCDEFNEVIRNSLSREAIERSCRLTHQHDGYHQLSAMGRTIQRRVSNTVTNSLSHTHLHPQIGPSVVH